MTLQQAIALAVLVVGIAALVVRMCFFSHPPIDREHWPPDGLGSDGSTGAFGHGGESGCGAHGGDCAGDGGGGEGH